MVTHRLHSSANYQTKIEFCPRPTYLVRLRTAACFRGSTTMHFQTPTFNSSGVRAVSALPLRPACVGGGTSVEYYCRLHFPRLHSIPPVPPTFTRTPSRQLLQTDAEHLLELPDRKRTHLFSHVCVFSIVSLHSLAHTTFLLLSRPFCTSPSSTTTAQRLKPARPADCHPSSQPAQLVRQPAKCFWEL